MLPPKCLALRREVTSFGSRILVSTCPRIAALWI